MPNKKAPKLTSEIGRLYRLGQKPISYEGTVTTEIMMMLYLTNKYNIKSPELEDIREEYKLFGLLKQNQSKRSEEKPTFYSWELEIDCDDNERLIRSNAEEYTNQLYWKLRELIDANPGKKVMCAFNVGFYTKGVVVNGHIETIIYDPALNILEHIDSNNLPKQFARKAGFYSQYCLVKASIVRNVAEMLDEQPVLVDNKDIYSGYAWGIQSLEASSDLLSDQERLGYCLMWASLFADIALAYPDYSMKEIVETVMKKGDSASNKHATVNDYCLLIIRGYVVDISKKLGVDFMDKDSMHAACVRLA
jgi:hypothetical protein